MSVASPRKYSPLRQRARRLLALFEEPVVFIARVRAIRRSARLNVDTARRWRRRRSLVTILQFLSYLGAVALVLIVGWSFYVMLKGPGNLKSLNDRCDRYGAACQTVSGFLVPLLSVALASAIFLFYRLRYVKASVAKKARTSPGDLVETATPDIGRIVGRDELCQVIMEDIRHRDIRRPHLVVGGVGTGKTAVLVRLTKLLAEHRAIPVPIRLRDARDSLNFGDMAYQRFLSLSEGRLLSTGEAEKVWRQLRKDDKIVVIADGLEEALTEGRAHQDRDNLIRLAIHHARELDLPLVIASRPHDPLRGADATILELEPLSEEAALEYIDQGYPSEDTRRLDWIVETAGLAELPLYLQITRQLCKSGRLDHLSASRSAKKVDTRSPDRSELRLHLLDTWMEALFDGRLMPAVPLSSAEREATVEWLSAFACIGLMADTIDVKFDDYYNEKPNDKSPKFEEIEKEIKRVLKEKLPRRDLDMRLAVTWGDRLQLVEAHGDGLRFPHSIMQAYLGSRFMRTALNDTDFRAAAAASLKSPGRELLISLVLYSRSEAAYQDASAAGQGTSATPRTARKCRWPRMGTVVGRPATTGSTATTAPAVVIGGTVGSVRDAVYRSADSADRRDDVKRLDMFAAALEIDSFLLSECRHGEIAKSVAHRWVDIRSGDQRTIDEAKLGLVSRFGDAMRAIARPGVPERPDPAYRELLGIGCSEPSYPIRLAIAQEIGAGGDEAFKSLGVPAGRAGVWDKTAGLSSARDGQSGNNTNQSEDDSRTLRGRILCAWVIPLLVGSVDECREGARKELREWLSHVGRDDADRSRDPLPFSVEVALAQGFKYAANRRHRHPHALPETRFYLAEQAMEMLKRARFWFSQLTLIQALCLWEMPDPSAPHDDDDDRTRSGGESRAKYPARQPGSNPKAVVGCWLEVARNSEHPFVAAAGKLAIQALKTGRPQRFLWIDEGGIIANVGSRAARATNYRKHHLWIPPSAGWAVLDPRAQQLVADVLLVLNLAEREQQPEEIEQVEQRLRRVDGSDLPPCLTRHRDQLDPSRTVGGLYTAPGAKCVDGCRFRLCPYPPAGLPLYRSELGEAFCRGQQTLLSRGLTSPWQLTLRGDLKRFWAQMANRARGGSADADRD